MKEENKVWEGELPDRALSRKRNKEQNTHGKESHYQKQRRQKG
jgi:hypothetical protein